MDHNVFFEGKVPNLTLQTGQGRATVGVIKPGELYILNNHAGKMVVTSGALNVTFPIDNFGICTLPLPKNLYQQKLII